MGAAALEAGMDHLKADGLLAFPTETVWGLAACANSPKAMDRLCEWKGRKADHPIALLVSGSDEVALLDFDVSPAAAALMDAFWPGPLTLVLACRASFCPGIAREDGAVGVRCSSHPAALELARRSYQVGVGPLTATSLNRSGQAPARSRMEAEGWVADSSPEAQLHLLDTPIEAGGGSPSTVVDLAGDQPEVLRAGALELDPLVWLESRGLFGTGVL